MVDSFLKYLQFEKRVSPHTLRAYQTDLLQFQDFLKQTFPSEKIEFVNHGLVRAWIISLAEQGIESRSVNRKIASLKSFFKFLTRLEVIANDPMQKVRVLKSKKKLPSFINENDMNRMLDSIPFEDTFEDWRNKLVLELFYSTGIRLSELINLKESHIDLKNQTMKVRGKRNKERLIPFPAALVSTINSYVQIRNKSVPMGNNEYFFVTDSGKPCYPVLIYRVVKKYLDSYSTVEKRSPHVLRHTYATHLLNKGADINAVKDLLGHANLAATQVYTHNSIDKLKRTFDKAHPKA